MKLLGLVTEFNPLHFGHLHYVKGAQKMVPDAFMVAVMSPNFVQRGAPALVDKWVRAQTALGAGVDLVLELPTLFAMQSADRFAKGALDILCALPGMQGLAFGAESRHLSPLLKIANLLINPEVEAQIYQRVREGASYPKAREAILSCFLNPEELDALRSPNNILALSYLKYLAQKNWPLTPYHIKRIGAGYHEEELQKISSASGIRKALAQNINCLDLDCLPAHTANQLALFEQKIGSFAFLEHFEMAIRNTFLIQPPSFFQALIDYEPGLENRIKNSFKRHQSLSAAIEEIQCKRYTKVRIQRFLMHAALGINASVYHQFCGLSPAYVRVLAANERGLKILRMLKQNAPLKIVTGFSDGLKSLPPSHAPLLAMENHFSNLYYNQLGAFEQIDSEYLKNPFRY